MIITSPINLEIGKVYNEKNLGIPFEILHDFVKSFTFKVVKECTEIEFITYIYETYPEMLASQIAQLDYFYEIQTD